jgi:hypothetical protein
MIIDQTSLPPHWQRIIVSEPERFKGVTNIFEGVTEQALYTILYDWSGSPSGYYIRSVVSGKHEHYLGAMPLAFISPPMTGNLILTEGIADLMTVYKYAACSAAILNNGLNLYQARWINLLYRTSLIRRVIIIHDNDVRQDGRNPGLIGANYSRKRLTSVGVPCLIYPTPYHAKDLGDLFGDTRIPTLISAYSNIR